MSSSESEDDNTEETYQLCERDRQIVAVTRHLLWEIVRWNQIQANQLEVVAKILQVLDRLPAVSDELFTSVLLKGPQRHFGDHKICHWWNVEVEDHDLAVSSGGYFHRPSTGGDSFTCMTWSATPGYETGYSDYLNTLQIVDDAQPFDAEVMQLALGEPGYFLEISADGEEISVLDEDEDDDESNEVDDSVTSDDATTVEPCDDSEQVLSKQADEATGRRLGDKCRDAPSQCDLCDRGFAYRKFWVDGSLRNDAGWANMCSHCFLKMGEGLGWGRGQLRSRQPNGEWLLVAGFAPTDDG